MAKGTTTRGKSEVAKGKYTIVKHCRKNGDLTTYGVRSPFPDLRDIVIGPWDETVIDPRWLDVPEFEVLTQNGIIQTYRSGTIPARQTFQVSDEYQGMLSSQEVAAIRIICEQPINEQLRAVIRLDQWVSDRGISNTQAPRVTKDYLKTHHVHFLRALKDLEERWQKRQEVLSVVSEALRRIEKM